MFSSQNRITLNLLTAAMKKSPNHRVCKKAFGIEVDDAQSVGYDSLCALAIIFRAETRDSYQSIFLAEKAVQDNLYCKGFQEGWDGNVVIGPHVLEYAIGYEDGKALQEAFTWNRSTTRSVCYGR